MPVADTSRAVFLSYASQDAEAAERIATVLRAEGIEVWFDKSQLRGGDTWDRQIRKEIHDCRLFIAVISARTESRDEGYFRREWKLAVDRTVDLAADVPFLLPVVIDDTNEATSRVPDEFLRVQWIRLPAGSATPTFVERIARLMAGGVRERPEPMRAPQLPRRADTRQRVLYGAIGAAAALAFAYFAFERLTGSGPHGPGAASIAVLPLANESGEASQRYFSDGISEDLITALSQFSGLKVIGRSSAFQCRDSREDSRSIGAKLGVAHLLEGSVRRSADMVRVSAELIDTADGSTQWSERYDRPYKDLFALQDEITLAVAGALKAKLLPGQHAAEQSDRPPGGSVEAYNALLQGRFFHLRNTEADLRKAIEFYTQALELDPRYALAWSWLSQSWTSLSVEFLDGAPAQQASAKAREAADRALALSPDLAAAHVARAALLQLVDLDWRGAETEYRRAVALAPNSGGAKIWLGSLLASFGELEPAIELTRQALATEPLRADSYQWLAVYLSALNRLDEAERAIRRAIELQPASSSYYCTLTIIEVQRGHAQAALAAAQQEPPGVWQDVALALARQIGGDRSAADAALGILTEKDASLSAYQIAQVHALRNDATKTFEWLDRAWSNRDSGIGYLLYDPFILRYKGDPRFAAFCRKVGLPVPGETPARKSA
jgi:TolB-like protein/Tfp pilus assembly protein PilF